MIIAISGKLDASGAPNIAASLSAVMANAAVEDASAGSSLLQSFQKPSIHTARSISIEIPKQDRERCTNCGNCRRMCEHDLIIQDEQGFCIQTDRCRGCGGCLSVCRARAITRGTRTIGEVLIGEADGIPFVSGSLRDGEEAVLPLIRAIDLAAQKTAQDRTRIILCPEGFGRDSLIAAKDADSVLVVVDAEADVQTSLQYAAAHFGNAAVRPLRVLIRTGSSDTASADAACALCRSRGFSVLGTLRPTPEDLCSAASGKRFSDMSQEWTDFFITLSEMLLKEPNHA